MTDSPDFASSEDKEEPWAAFEDTPAASTEFTGGDDDFCEKEPQSLEEEDEWNDFEFASAPQEAVVDHPQETQKSEPTFSEGGQPTATTSFASPQFGDLSVVSHAFFTLNFLQSVYPR